MAIQRRLLHTLSILSFCVAGTHAAAADEVPTPAEEKKEPPIQYTLTIGDETVSLTEGQTVAVEGTFANPTIRLTADPHRQFSRRGISFEYPRHFTFEADFDDPDEPNWTLSGNDFKIMLLIIVGRVSAAQLAESMIDQFGEDACSISESQSRITLGQHELSGTTVRLHLADHDFSQQIYRVEHEGEMTKMLILQDYVDAKGRHTREGKKCLKLLKSSFQVEE